MRPRPGRRPRSSSRSPSSSAAWACPSRRSPSPRRPDGTVEATQGENRLVRRGKASARFLDSDGCSRLARSSCSARSSTASAPPASRWARRRSPPTPTWSAARRRSATSSRCSRSAGCSPIRTRRPAACRPTPATATSSTGCCPRAARRASELQLSLVRREVDEAMRVTTETLSQVTNLLAIVSAPPIATTTLRHVEVLPLQPQVLMVVVITSTGGVSKRVFTFDRPVDPGLADWAASYLNEELVGMSIGSRMLQAKLNDPALQPHRARVHRPARARLHRAGDDGREHALRRRRRAAAVRAPLPGRVAAQRAAGRARAPRVAARRALAGARRARHLRPDRRRERDAGAALAVAGGRQLRPAAAQPRHGLGDRPDADGLRAGDHHRARGRPPALALRRGHLRGL